ncbi:MAG: sigma-70 family RNA polymerase sigma factor [Clostridia bacterium]|nr:sigma-70 family RNA polymerase sigma factor [Clostridia bacterium]
MLEMIMAIENEEDRHFVLKLVEDYYDKMILVAKKIVKDDSVAKDVAGATVENVINYIEKFKKADEEQYLTKLVIVTCRNISYKRYNAVKRDNSKKSSIVFEDEGERKEIELSDVEESVEDLIISEENCRVLRELIDALDDKYSDVIWLREQQYDNEEIAQILDISVDLVRQRTLRARKKILEMAGDRLYGIYGKR